MPHTDIVDMQHNDGLQPIAAQKLNYNFKRIASQLDAINQILDGRANTNSGAAKKADAKAEEALSLIPHASDDNPLMDGTADPGESADYSREDHVHPTDTSRAPVDHKSTSNTYGVGNGTNYGHLRLSDSTSGTAGTSGGYAATPKAVKDALTKAKDYADSLATQGAQPATATPLVDGTAAVGSSTKYAREDHVHPTDTALLASANSYADGAADTVAAMIPSTVVKEQYDVSSLLTSLHSNIDELLEATLVVNNRVAQLLVGIKTGTNSFNAGTSYNLYKLDSAIRPVMRASCGIDIVGAAARGEGVIRYNGQMYLRPNANIAAGSSVYIMSTYILDNEYHGPIS